MDAADGANVRRVSQVAPYKHFDLPRWSHDGRRLAFEGSGAVNKNKRLFIVNLDGTGLQAFANSAPDWSPDDKQLAFEFIGDRAARPGICVQNVDGRGRDWLLAGLCPRWSPDGSQMAYLSANQLMVRELIEGTDRELIGEPFDEIRGGQAWSPDGERIAFVGRRQDHDELWIISSAGWAKGSKMRWRGSPMGPACWSPDGRRLAVSLNDVVHTLDADDERAPQPLPGQSGKNKDPAWSPDGKRIALVSNRMWASEAQKVEGTGRPRLEEIQRYTKGSIVYGAAFTPDGRRLVLGGDPVHTGVQVWNLATDKAKRLGGQGISIAMFPDGRRFATSWLSPTIQIIDIDTGEIVRELQHGNTVRSIAVSKDGGRLLSGGLDRIARVWDPTSGETLCTFEEHQHWITRAAFSPNCREAITVGHDKTLRVWDANTARQRLAIAHPDVVWGLAVSPDGSQILTGTGGPLSGNPLLLVIDRGEDNTLRLWNSADGKLLREMRGHTHAAYTLDISPDGRLAVSGGWDGTIRLWDLQTGAELSRVEGGQGA